MADQDQAASLHDIALALAMDLGNQRAGGVENRQIALHGLAFHGLGNAVGAEDRACARRHFGQILDELRPHLLQPFDHIAVMDDLMADIDGRAIFRQSALDDLDGADDAGAEAARLGQDYLHISVLVSSSINNEG